MMKKKWGHQLVRLKVVDRDRFLIKASFEDGKNFVVSLAPYFLLPKGLAAEILRGGAFDRCFLESGALAWPNGFELCPDALRQLAEQQQAGSHAA